ncbi:hypothetical protein HPP92_009474 [Vanilla planifolia]|uniref:Nucleolar protein 6 n=1 Tax=Vanilla planifolia TaxID=51239 RepID=A0A835V6C5_VANPL|nr:hypothetical protein HPP92_009474 [Vanilla planifolia]
MVPGTDFMDFKVAELLKEVKLDASTTKTIDRVLSSVIDAISRIPKQKVGSEMAAGFIRDLGVPSNKVCFTFKGPETIQVCGSHSIGCVTKPEVNIDLLIRMPKKCFHEKDYLNHIYHAKRCLYLFVIYKSLKSVPLARKIQWSTFQNEARKPVLHLYPDIEVANLSEFFIRIIPTATTLFDATRLNMTRNNVRSFKQGNTLPPTPHYNSTILEDILLEENAKFVKDTFHGWKALGDALILVKVWACNRTSIYTYDCLNGYLIAFIMSYIASSQGGNRINRSMNALQIFRITLKFISSSFLEKDLANKPLGPAETLEGGYDSFTLQDEVAWTINCLDKCRGGGFEEVFMTKGFAKFGDEPMLVGLLLSSQEKSFRFVDIGPHVENNEEAELRRFKDGTIAESTVWDCPLWQRHLIMKRITEYVLSKHFLVSQEDLIYTVDQLDFCLHVGDPIASSTILLEAFEALSKRLQLLDDIPLRISSVQPLHPAFRQMAVFPPEPHPLAYDNSVAIKIPKFVDSCIDTLGILIKLEGSGNWPLDSEVIEKTKAAFLLKICKSLQERWGLYCTASEHEVNVLMAGYAFSLHILHERSLNLIRNQVGNEIRGKRYLDKELFFRSQHSSMINGLLGRYPSYGSVVRLAKRWVSSHLFSSFLEEEAIELLVAYLYLRPFSMLLLHALLAFLRFLRLLSNYDWRFSPLIVDINEDFTAQDD